MPTIVYSKLFCITLTTVLLGMLCILKMGGAVAIVATVVYCIMTFILSLGVLAQIRKPEHVAMQMGVVKGANGNPSINLKVYEEYIHIYENRLSSIWFWLFIPLALAWPAMFMLAGFIEIAYISLAAIVFSEIGKYRLYKTMKKNKTAWGAAAYINEVQNFFRGE